MSFFLLNRHHRTTANASTATNNTTKTTHTITYYHIQTHVHTTKHNQITNATPISSTDTGTSFQMVRGLQSHTSTVVSCMMRTCQTNKGMGHDPRTPTLRQVREVCSQREPTERVIIVIVAKREERERERHEKREREKGREKEREETPLLPSHPLPSSPCVGSKRFRV